jgi:chitin disaccharide deacetylase
VRLKPGQPWATAFCSAAASQWPGNRPPSFRFPVRIITNADDLGADVETNRAIFALMAEGLVTSASVLANGRATGAACQQSHNYNGRSFGVHLNLTEFSPLTAASGLGGLVGGQGDFCGAVRSVSNLRQLRRGIFEEWCAQVERVAGFGVRISHLDSHHHVHTVPALLPVLKAVQRRYGIRKVRISKNLYTREQQPHRTLRLQKVLFNTALRLWVRTRTTHVFTDPQGFYESRALIQKRQWAVEVMLHPGDLGGPQEASLLRRVVAEDPEVEDSLCSFHEL